MPNKKEYDLVSFTPEEGKKVKEALQKFLVDNQAELAVIPLINPNGTIGARVDLFKKVESVDKSVESPYVEPNGDTPETTKEA